MYTFEYKLKKLHSMNDEVKKFHPFLTDLFRKIPTILDVEYTHGPNEFGADFILTTKDNVLGTSEYVGVIVKQGSIKQNFDDIERQVKECQIPKKVAGGKKVVVLNQVWVVTNESISANAKEKVQHSYANQNVKFIWDEVLISLVDQHFSEFWEDITRNIGVYLNGLDKKVQDLNKKFSIIDEGLSDIYIDQQLTRISKNDIKKFKVSKKQKPQNISSIIQNERCFFIQAQMGYGKSRLLRQAALELTEIKSFSQNKVLPVFVEYRDLINLYSGSIDGLLQVLAEKENIPIGDLSLVIFIDSIDEIKGDNEEKVSTIINLSEQAANHQNIKIVFASRPLQNPLLEEQLDKQMSRYELSPLGMDRIVRFVERMCSQDTLTTKLKSDLSRSDLFRRLPRTPISAILLARVLNSNTKELPSTLPELYSKYMELVLGRWDIQKGKTSEKEYETAVILVRLFAKFMMENDLSSIGVGDAKEIIREYLGARETGHTLEGMFEKISICEQILNIDTKNNKLNFRHRSFLEFMYAEYLFFTYGLNATIQNPFDLFWGYANYFYFGKLKDCPEQLQTVFRQIPLEEAAKLSKLYNSGSYLLAAYQSPYKVITECLKMIITEATEFLTGVMADPEKSSFGHFPKVQLLAFLTYMLRRNLEYDFFKKALVELETEFFLEPDFCDKTAISAFFVSALRAGLGCKDAFEILIKEKRNDLPEIIQLGIIHVSEDVDLINDTIKKFEKNVKRRMLGSIDLKRSLYELPMIEVESKKMLSGSSKKSPIN